MSVHNGKMEDLVEDEALVKEYLGASVGKLVRGGAK
jgi:hypothetical protein